MNKEEKDYWSSMGNALLRRYTIDFIASIQIYEDIKLQNLYPNYPKEKKDYLNKIIKLSEMDISLE